MSDDIDLDDDPDEDGLYADEDQLELVGRFGASLGAIPWFSRVGARLEEREVREARGYLDALGFPDVDVARIASFADAAEAAASEAEEQLRAALTDDAVARIGAEALSVAMTHIAARAATSIDDKITRAAQLWDVEDDALLNAAKGAAIKAAHEAALVLLAGAEETHPFALKFRLFERGRWPVSVAGASFNLF